MRTTFDEVGLKEAFNGFRGDWPALPESGLYERSRAEVVTDFWFNELGFSVLRVPKAIANTASRRISVKQGMRVIATE